MNVASVLFCENKLSIIFAHKNTATELKANILGSFVLDIPKPKLHHPDVFPEGGTSNLSITHEFEQHARQFFQVFYLENQVKNPIKPGFQDATHMLTHRFWG